MNSLVKTAAGAGIVLALLMVFGGNSVHDAYGYLQAYMHATGKTVVESVPWAVEVERNDAELAEFEREVIGQEVQMDLSTEEIKRRRTELGKLVRHAERVQRLLVTCCPVLDDAIRLQRATVSFSGTEMPLSEFQSVIDDLLAQQKSSASEITTTREELGLLEKEHAQAKTELAEARRTLRAAKSEAKLLKSQHEHAEIEASTIHVIMATSENLKAPQESMSNSLHRMRDRVAKLKAHNRVLWATASEDIAGRRLLASLDRIEALKAIHDDDPSEKNRRTQPAASRDTVDRVDGATGTATPHNGD